MSDAIKARTLALFLFCGAAAGQVLSLPSFNNGISNPVALDAIQGTSLEFDFLTIGTSKPQGTRLQSPSNSISKLDLKAPRKAQQEYTKGNQMLMGKDLPGAVEHLAKATSLYENYVAAHNALGTAYLDLNQNVQARDEFAKAVALDGHLPNSSVNLGIAQLALKDYSAAEESLRKASSIAPLDLQLSTALAYGEFMNHDYPAVIATAEEVHSRQHKGAAEVHYFAAGAWEAQDRFAEAQREIETLLQEDPNSPLAPQFRQVLQLMKAEEAMHKEAKLQPPAENKIEFVFNEAAKPTSEEASGQARQILQALKEKQQIADAEMVPDRASVDHNNPPLADSDSLAPIADATPHRKLANFAGTTFKTSVDEVAIFFTATDHGKSVTSLTPSDLQVRDNGLPPEAILGFHNESGLPLRLGLVIDISNSVKDRLPFEQAAAAKFLQQVVRGKEDLAFVIGVNNSVLLVQDFTDDQTLATDAINQLAAGGATALWDAVAFAAEKLSKHQDSGPVARILVVISDGEDNSSGATLKQAITSAQHGDIAIYTVSTRDTLDVANDVSSLTDVDVGEHALTALSELTGGASFRPGSVRRLNASLAELQQVIRSRYVISYRPASFQRDGHYRLVNLTAEKDGKKLKIFARQGYYASTAQPGSAQ